MENSVKDHYAKHLGPIYSWMIGDFAKKQKEQQQLLEDQDIHPRKTGIAIDLGAGNGLQSVSLANIGFQVTAIEFDEGLIGELRARAEGLDITIFNDDIRNVRHYNSSNPELIVCAGDTITHLQDKIRVKQLIDNIASVLSDNGKLILSFRDYSNAVTGLNRFIPVKSDDNRILTCVLDYADEYVVVTDLLHIKSKSGWHQTLSSYRKVRLGKTDISSYLNQSNLKVIYESCTDGLNTVIAEKNVR